MDRRVLFGQVLRSSIVWDRLGSVDQERLRCLLALSRTERITLTICLASLFPDKERQHAQAALRAFRNRFNTAFSDLDIRFEVDSRKKTPPHKRFCWFTGPATSTQPELWIL